MTARGVGDARQLDQALADPSAAIVVCAADLPESDGYAVAARLRISTGAGIVMLMPDDRRESRSEEHTSELQSLMRISYAVFCLKKKQKKTTIHIICKKMQSVRSQKMTT